jgi:molybdopterin adenylyltransferase
VTDPVRLAIVTVSDGVAAGARADGSGDAIENWAREHGWLVVVRDVIADDAAGVTARLVELADGGSVDVILTTGGTGLTMRDVTPEATLAALHREAPGIAELLRREGAAQTPYAALSRGVAGTRGRVLIVNLPGSRSGTTDGLAVLAGIAGHAVQLLRGTATQQHDPGQGTSPGVDHG